MSDENFDIDRQVSVFYAESKEDYISLSYILRIIGDCLAEESEADRAAFGIIRGLLALGLEAGDLTSDNGFAPWSGQDPDAVMERITRKRQAPGHDPSAYDHTWFHRPGQSFTKDANNKIEQKILMDLRVCYGSLVEPNFRKVYKTLEGGIYRDVVKYLQEIGAKITDTTDFNDDVSIQLVLDRAGDQVCLALSGVGLFAAVLHQDAEGRYSWVTHPEEAPTPLAATVARIVHQAGFRLLDRGLVSQSIAMNWYDGSTEVLLYQLLFTDRDVIP